MSPSRCVRRSLCFRIALAPVLVLWLGVASPLYGADEVAEQLQSIELPEGFKIELFSDQVPGARSLTRSPAGVIYVGTMRPGKVYAVLDKDGNGKADAVHEMDQGLNQPNGVAFHEGDLYVAEIHRVLRYEGIEARLENPPEPIVITDNLPDKRHHGWKFIAFGPDGALYVPVGAPCNVCDVEDPFAAILRMDKDSGEYTVVARGVRNTVGFDWHPKTGDLYFTDNGRDMLGDDLPPDEFNRVAAAVFKGDAKAPHFGFPFCHAGGLEDPEFKDRGQCSEITEPVQALAPHTAAIGMRFYRGEAFPKKYRGQAFIAEHGSWNRSEPIGYRVTVVHLDDAGFATEYEVFAKGWLRTQAQAEAAGSKRRSWGRPADLQELPDGSLLLSDDQAGALYRISYEGN